VTSNDPQPATIRQDRMPALGQAGNRVVRVELYHFAAPLPQRFSPSWIPGFRQRENRATLVRVVTADGVEGWSAGQAMATEREGLGGVLGPYLLGQDAVDIDAIQQRLRELAYTGWRNWWIEPAFWDIAGKVAGEPVCRLLGGEPRRVSLYASTGEVRAPQDAVETAQARQHDGFAGIKIRVHEDEERDLAQLTAVAEELADEMKVGVDANQGWRVAMFADAPTWDLDRAKRFADACADLGVSWLEEPLPMDDYDALAELTASTEVDITGGELHTSGEPELRMMIERRCYDKLQPDAMFTGGIAQTARVIQHVREAGLRYTPHTWTNGVGFAANLHLMAASGFADSELLEYPIDLPGFTPEARDAMLTEPFLHEHGTIEVPAGPGLGIDIDPGALQAHARLFFEMER
jgi:D-galactarolactone cycloisomerase